MRRGSAGYAPNSLAQSLSIGRTRLIGMVVADVSNPFFGRLLKQVERLALEKNHLVILSRLRRAIRSASAQYSTISAASASPA